jgi:predicted transposase YdaD
MSGQSDPALKALVETAPADWLPLVGRRRARVTVEDADIATVVSGAGDKVLRVHARPPYLLHFDFQSGHDSARLPKRLRLYNAVLDYRHDLPVLSVAVLLQPEADSPQLTGKFERAFKGEQPYSFLRYEVLRVWTLSVEMLLAGGLGTLPLAPISNVTQAELPGVVGRMQEQLTGQPRGADILAISYVLVGMRYSPEFAEILFREVRGMKESSTYQAIVAEGRVEGRVEGARAVLLVQGTDRFGPPDAATRKAINAIGDLQQLQQLARKLLTAETWGELLGTAAPQRRRNRRKTEG